MIGIPTRALAIGALVCALAGPVAPAMAGNSTPSLTNPSAIQQALSSMMSILAETAATITGATAALEASELLENAANSLCQSSPFGAMTEDLAQFALQQGLTGMPPPGGQLNQSQCDQLGGALQSSTTTAQNTLSSNAAKYKAEEQTMSALINAFNDIASTTGLGLLVKVIEGEASDANAAAARTLVVSARGPTLRSVRIYFDKRKVAERGAARATARIQWRRAKPGLHRVRVIAIDASGKRLQRHIWLLRRDERIARLIKRAD